MEVIQATFMVSLTAVSESGSDAFKEGEKQRLFHNIEKMEEKFVFNANIDINLSLSLTKLFIIISCN